MDYIKMKYFSRFMVTPQDPKRTDLLMGEAPKTNQGSSQAGVLPGHTRMDYHAH
jgi:hypothetical protein